MKLKLYFWGAVFLGILAFLITFQAILLPFVTGVILAYLLDPVVDFLEKKKISRSSGAIITLTLFAVVLASLVLLFVPLVLSQVEGFAVKIVEFVGTFQTKAGPLLSPLLESDLKTLLPFAKAHIESALLLSQSLVQSISSSGASLIAFLSMFFVMPIVAFYILRDWEKLIAKLTTLIPRRYLDVTKIQAKKIDDVLSGYLRGVASVCFILGIFYAISLKIIGVEFGIIIGLLSGILSFIPYVGSAFGFVLGTAFAYLQFTTLWPVMAVVGVFGIGQLIEGNILTPKLVGDKIGVHPVWIIFALFAGGSLFGFLGIMLAVPIAAVLGVLVRFALELYLSSSLYS
ncbi:MAG: AI-2E family transporter [Alphaproteobacteria bacterium]